jgi:hypothetical protein
LEELTSIGRKGVRNEKWVASSTAIHPISEISSTSAIIEHKPHAQIFAFEITILNV